LTERGEEQLTHVITELGLRFENRGAVALGCGDVLPEACVPGTDVLRTSVIATWADIVTGAVAGHAISPRIPLTLDLEVQVVAPVRVGMAVLTKATSVRIGKRVVVTTAEFRDASSDELLAVAFASFMPATNPAAVFPYGFPRDIPIGRLSMPLAERIGRVVVERGVVEVPHRPDGLNAVAAIQGGLLAFAAEEAAASLTHERVLTKALVLRYLRPFMVGPARAVASGDGTALSVVQVSDAGAGKLGLVATARNRILAG
jgi:acyl-coenzyme A thioesterase PaaI-like protein